ncbi:contactin-associated protein-like 2 isoform X2 [Haliotis rubra]|uniref:contactin-associated protein-like 2 isoform X2 n=1 Tax=Haliotis rubra TaxID=36100 RepID=UPI001EE606E6|nr:contactin-associated protein-like 2 isoform X2 [Haliotis rubra]
MTSENGTGVTVIRHDSEEQEEVVGYEGAGEYVLRLNYNVSLDHAIAIIDASENCRQFVQWKCKAALIHNPNANGVITTGWRNRTGGIADYFGDATPGSGMCTCGMTGSCADPTRHATATRTTKSGGKTPATCPTSRTCLSLSSWRGTQAAMTRPDTQQLAEFFAQALQPDMRR